MAFRKFKLEKHLIDAPQLEQMSAEGVKFVTGASGQRTSPDRRNCSATLDAIVLPAERSAARLNVRDAS